MNLSRLATAAAVASLFACATAARADGLLLSESFDDISTLAGAGWVLTNASPVPGTSWFQGNDGIFAAQSGAPNAYIGANFVSATSGALSLWLITPTLDLSTAGTLTFYTRSGSDTGFADSLQVRASSGSGSSTATFTTLLTAVNPLQGVDLYPTAWTQYTVSYAAMGGVGRLAFIYTQANVDNANYIGIDGVSVTSAVPEPAAYGLMAVGLGLVALRRRQSAAV